MLADEFGWTVERYSDFADISEELLERIFGSVWWNVATVAEKGRPRSCIPVGKQIPPQWTEF